jgi:transposase-like protein
MKTKAPTLRQFQDRFPTEDSCLEHLKLVRFGERHDCEACGKNAKFYRIAKRRSYGCEYCGHQIYPTAGTPFHKTRTSLRDWFHVMFLFCTTRNGVAAKEVERQIGVTYKTAWRMCHEIRKYMAIVDGDEPIGGEGKTVEVDETLIGGATKGGGRGNYRVNKTIVVGAVERGGNVITRIIPNIRKHNLLPVVKASVRQGSKVHTDQNHTYRSLPHMGFEHQSVNHNRDEYVRGDSHVQTIEGFWAQLKRGINGTHIHVSQKHLAKYLGEFEFRHNRRNRPETMLSELMLSFAR